MKFHRIFFGLFFSSFISCNLLASEWQPISEAGSPHLSSRGAWARDATLWPSAVMSSIVRGKLVVVGTKSNTGRIFSGGIYNFSDDSWSLLPEKTIPEFNENVFDTSNVADGESFYVWGGCYNQYCKSQTNLGWKIDPMTNNWSKLPQLNAPSPRHGHKLVMLDERLLVWFGRGSNTWELVSDICYYDPSTDAWTKIVMDGGPSPRLEDAVWYANNKLFVWGGRDGNGRLLRDGFVYDFSTNSWSQLEISSLNPRYGASVTKIGDKVMIWGGKTIVTGDRFDYLTDGAIFDPRTGVSTAVPNSTSNLGPSKREQFLTTWTGSQFIVWGGIQCGLTGGGSQCSSLSDGYSYDMDSGLWEKLPNYDTAYPATLNWNGQELVLWGGVRGDWSSSYSGAKIKLGSSGAFATKSETAIENPQLVFDSEHLSKLELCLLDSFKLQSPEELKSVIAGGSPSYAEDQQGNPIKSVVTMLLAGVKINGGRVGYRVRFKTNDDSDWLYFQSGQVVGVYASNMSSQVEVLDFRSNALVYTADISSCSNKRN